MAQEREVIDVRYVFRFGRDVPKYVYDYSTLEVGDWFIAKGGARVRSALVSVRKHPLARTYEFEKETISPTLVKYTRTA